MADGKITIETQLDTDGVEKGIKKIDKSLSALKGASMTGVIAAETKALKKLIQTIGDTSKAYDTQLKAEKQLEAAAKNNPYLSDTSVKQLKQYASELQSVGTVGDEELLPLMSQLAAAGRTQSEIQTIMNAALDISASGMMSLDSAVTQLNGTMSGNIGLLGRQFSELKNLTEEELKSGDAIKILGDKFKGMNEEVTKASGSYQQMQNAAGDFKEAVGTITKPTADLWNKFWKGWYERGIERINKLTSYLDAMTLGKDVAEQFQKELAKFNPNDLRGMNDYTRKAMSTLTDDELKALKEYYEIKKTLSNEDKFASGYIDREIDARHELALQLQAEAEDQAKLDRELAEGNKESGKAAEVEKTREEIIKESDDALKTRLERIQREAEVLGDEVDTQEQYNVMLASYLDLCAELGEDDPYSEERLYRLRQFIAHVGELNEETEETGETLDQINYAEKFNEIKDYFNELADITSNITGLIADTTNEQVSGELSALSKSYTDGLISYEEYCEKKKEIDKKAAKETYKIKMWEWSASLLQATANVAQGVSAALAGPPPASYVQAALTASAGAVQIATLTANKPKAPAFNSGGIVGGNDYSDGITAHVSSGEAIFNKQQQKNLWEMANGRAGGGASVNMPVSIINNNGSKVSTQLNKNGLRVIIDDAVNSSMMSGNYTQSMQIADSKSSGARVL